MCCFSDEVEKVSDTHIFVRALGARQLVVYGMELAARNELAMVLPIPTPPGAAEDAVRFVTLDKCPDFFAELRSGFPTRYEGDDSIGMLSSTEDMVEVQTLEVHEVGSYEASFVPRPEDFARLDERFRLPVKIWLHLDTYRDWGFAVFKLKPTPLARVHPMAFEFERRDRTRLFFPTLHLHGPHLDDKADFDHSLYCQAEPAMNWHLKGWLDSKRSAGDFVRCREAVALMEADAPCWRLILEGERENRDTWVGKGGRIPECAPPT